MASCIIYVQAHKVPDNIWNGIKALNISSIYTFNDLISNTKCIRTGNGFFVKMHGELFVISCNHIIGSAYYNIYAFHNDLTKIQLNVFRSIPELDIVILKPMYDCDCTHINFDIIPTINYIKKRMDDIVMIVGSVIETDDVTYTVIKTSAPKLKFDHVYGNIIPKVPLITFTCDKEDVYGFSGSSLLIDDQIIGIVNNYSEDGYLAALPLPLVALIASNAIQHNPIFKGVYLATEIIEVEEEQALYHLITNTGQIKYGKFKFGTNDIICGINGKGFNEDGYIFCDGLDMSVPLGTFVMIETYLGNTLNFKLIKCVGGEHKNDPIEQMVQPNLYDDMYNVSVFNKHRYCCMGGLIFTELSEELILAVGKTGVVLDGPIFGQYKTLNFLGGKAVTKYVVLIDVDYKMLSVILADKLKDKGVPYVKYGDNYQLLILTKINGIEIKDFEGVENALGANAFNITLTCVNQSGKRERVEVEV